MSDDKLSVGDKQSAIATVDDGAVAGRVTEITPGDDTVSVTVDADDLEDAVSERHDDDYPTVWLVSDGERLAVCDHKEPMRGADEPPLTDFDPGVHRVEVVDAPDANQSLFGRSHLQVALERVDGQVTIHLDDEFPVGIVGQDSIAVAPKLVRTTTGGAD